MKTLLQSFVIFISIGFTSISYAEQMSNINGMNMQQMMAQMQKMQQCLLQVDEAELRQYEARINQLEPQLKSLCQQGKRDEAQNKAIAFGKEVANSSSIKIIKECTKNMQTNGFMPPLPDFDDLGDRHICDELDKH